MSTTYAQKKATAQKKEAPTASAVLDSSSQSEGLQRKADMANNITQFAGGRHAFWAGTGTVWHIHYNHIKFNDGPRVTFVYGVTPRQQILNQLRRLYIPINQSIGTRRSLRALNVQSWIDCWRWLSANQP